MPLLFGSVTQIHDLTVTEQAAAIRAGETSSAEITDHYLERIDRLNEQVGAFYTVTHELAREQAAAADKAASASRKDGAELPPLTGVPIPIKDCSRPASLSRARPRRQSSACPATPRQGSARPRARRGT